MYFGFNWEMGGGGGCVRKVEFVRMDWLLLLNNNKWEIGSLIPYFQNSQLCS